MSSCGGPPTCDTGVDSVVVGDDEVVPSVLVTTKTGWAVVPMASLMIGPNCGVIVSFVGDVLLVLELSVNFCWKTSVMSFWMSGDSGTVVWLMTPLLMLI